MKSKRRPPITSAYDREFANRRPPLRRPVGGASSANEPAGGFAEGILDETPAAETPHAEQPVKREPIPAGGNGAAGSGGTAEGPVEVGEDGQPLRRRRRRGRRGGRRHRRRDQRGIEPAAEASAESVEQVEDEGETDQLGVEQPKSPARNDDRSYRSTPASVDEATITEPAPLEGGRPPDAFGEAATEAGGVRGRRRRGRRGGRGRRRAGDAPAVAPAAAEARREYRDDEAMEVEIEVPREAEVVDVDEELEAEAVGRVVVRTIVDPHRSVVREGREMLINVADADECRIAMLSNGRLDELDMERVSAASHVGNIYKGRVTNVEPSIQAAFVDFGLTTQGFLHISDLHPKYFPDGDAETERVGRKTPRRERPPIQRCLRRGQEVIVQITKEGIGTKGPTLTTYISVPGRFLVMMPDMNELGVSRKIEDEETRRTLREMLSQLTLPPNMGFIMRTAAIDRTKRDLQRDLTYLLRLWKSVEERIRAERAPCVLYQESDLVIRTIRDVFDSDVKRILCDHAPTAERIADFLSIASPKSRDCIFLYNGREPLFHLFNIEAEIEKLHSKNVPLQCGGSLVIESTEALVAIDVNSGRFRVPDDPEETARRVNLEAAEEIARHLRLRDLGGLIICDFIDMRFEKNKRMVEKRLRDSLKDHKERAKLLKMSQFGIIEMTRQRQRPSISRSVYQDCPRCRGTGMVKTPESVTLDVMRAIQVASGMENVAIIDVQLSTAVANHLLNRKRRILTDIEHETRRTILIRGVEGFAVDEVRYSCTDRRGREIPFSDVHSVQPAAGLGHAGARPGGNHG